MNAHSAICKPCIEILKALFILLIFQFKDRHDANYFPKRLWVLTSSSIIMRESRWEYLSEIRECTWKKHFHRGVGVSVHSNYYLRWLLYAFRRLRYYGNRFWPPSFFAYSSFIRIALFRPQIWAVLGMKLAAVWKGTPCEDIGLRYGVRYCIFVRNLG